MTVSPRNARARLTSREFAYRSAFELGRHLIGYEVQKVLALVDLVVDRLRPRRTGSAFSATEKEEALPSMPGRWTHGSMPFA